MAALDLAVFSNNASTISDMIADMHEEGVFNLVLRSEPAKGPRRTGN